MAEPPFDPAAMLTALRHAGRSPGRILHASGHPRLPRPETRRRNNGYRRALPQLYELLERTSGERIEPETVQDAGSYPAADQARAK